MSSEEDRQTERIITSGALSILTSLWKLRRRCNLVLFLRTWCSLLAIYQGVWICMEGPRNFSYSKGKFIYSKSCRGIALAAWLSFSGASSHIGGFVQSFIRPYICLSIHPSVLTSARPSAKSVCLSENRFFFKITKLPVFDLKEGGGDAGWLDDNGDREGVGECEGEG